MSGERPSDERAEDWAFPKTPQELIGRYQKGERNFSARGNDETGWTVMFLGEQPNLRGAQLSDANLRGAQLSNAMLRGANLAGADLYKCNLEGASLRNVNLQGARFSKANLYAADLTNADLGHSVNDPAPSSSEDAKAEPSSRRPKSLRREQLAGTNLASAILPEHIDASFSAAIRSVEDASKNARVLFFSLLASCLFIWLVVGKTTDLELLLADGDAKLPFVNAEIPIIGFYLVAPVLLLAVYTYFHLYLSTLWDKLAHLPAFLPDGTAMDKAVYPWLLTSLARKHVRLLRESSEQPSAIGLKQFLSVTLAYLLVPVTLWFVFGRFLAVHDARITVPHFSMFFISCCLALWFRTSAGRDLSCRRDPAWGLSEQFGFGRLQWRSPKLLRWIWLDPPEKREPIRWPIIRKAPEPWRKISTFAPWISFVVPLAVTWTALMGDAGWLDEKLGSLRPISGIHAKLELARAEVVAKPETWHQMMVDHTKAEKLLNDAIQREKRIEAATQAAAPPYGDAVAANSEQPNDELAAARVHRVNAQQNLAQQRESLSERVVPLDLNYRDFRYANLFAAFVRQANLVEAELDGANLAEADLRGANIQGAKLRGAGLQGTYLEGAKLNHADLSGADLTGANLEWAQLNGVNFQGAKMKWALLQHATFKRATGLTCQQLRSAQCFDSTTFTETDALDRKRCCTETIDMDEVQHPATNTPRPGPEVK